MDKRHYQKRMANIEQLHHPLGPIAFLDTIDFLRNIGRNRKTRSYIQLMENLTDSRQTSA